MTQPSPTDQCCDLQVWPLTRVLTDVRCGSQDWTWDEEWADLDQRHAETGYLITLEQQIRENGITMPVLIGSDGRLWDCLLYTSPSPRDLSTSRMPSSA